MTAPAVPAPAAGPLPPDFGDRVVAWQRRHGRHDLPWQASRDPYRVWLSEIMLQQTQVATVRGYYARFLERFPTIADLAAAPAQDVLAFWSGLGYYARARNLHRCAQVVMSEHAGRFPSSAAGLAGLPGIGRSTAAAIAAFCFGERAAILDGNVKRVLARVLAYEGDLAGARAQKVLWEAAGELLPAAEPGPSGSQAMADYTQGLMDLGATVCTTRRPACEACPVAGLCRARAAGTPEAFPVKTRRLRRGERSGVLLWLQQHDRVWLVPRPEHGVWAELWSLPEFATASSLEDAVGDWPGTLEWLPPFKHVLTHFDWMLQPLRLAWHGEVAPAHQRALDRLRAVNPSQDGAPGRWVARAELSALGLPAPIRRLLETP